MELSREAIEMLKKSGWYLGRRIDITETEKFLRSRGFELSYIVIKFLQEFNELEFNVLKSGRGIYHHYINPRKALGEYFTRDDVREYEDYYVGEPLIQVGRLCDDNLDLLISTSGKMYCDLGMYGSNVLEGLNNLLTGKLPTDWGLLKNQKC